MKPASESNRFRVAIMGTGRWGRNVVRAFQKVGRAEIVWLVDPDPEALALASALAPGARLAPHISEAVPDVQGVAICTPARDHVRHALPLLESGKRVLLEKPVAMCTADAIRLARASRSTGALMAGHQLLFHPAFETLQERIGAGILGRLIALRTERTGAIDLTREPGVLWSYGPHDVAMVLALTGQTPTRVSATEPSRSGAAEAADPVDLTLDFPSGVRAEIHLSSRQNDRQRRLVALCENGTLVFDDAEPGGKLLAFGGACNRIEAAELPKNREEPLVRECAHFVAAALRDGQPLTGMDHAMQVTGVLESAARSIEVSEIASISSAC